MRLVSFLIILFISVSFVHDSERINCLTIEGELSATDRSIKMHPDETGFHRIDEFSVDVNANERLLIEAVAQQYNPILLMRDSLGKEIIFAPKHNFSYGAVLDTILQRSGTYKIFISTLYQENEGAYTLRINTANANALNVPSDADFKTRFGFLTDQSGADFYFLPVSNMSEPNNFGLTTADCSFQLFPGKNASLKRFGEEMSYQQELFVSDNLKTAKKQYENYKSILISNSDSGWKSSKTADKNDLFFFRMEKCINPDDCKTRSNFVLELKKQAEKYLVQFTFTH